jgi:hypothetical protein
MLIVLLSRPILGKPMDTADSGLMEKTLAVVRDCMARHPAPWAKAWQREYLNTIREAIIRQEDTSQYARRLQILRDGFGPYWEDLKNSEDRSLFEVRRAQIRWYLEQLMDAELPSEVERQKLRDQYKALSDYATSSLLSQFSFLDPNMVQKAKADYLGQCCRGIDTPLLPVFLVLFSNAQMEQVKQRWHDLRYARVDLWRKLANSAGEDHNPGSARMHPDYVLTEKSLAQLWVPVWKTVVSAPDYYRSAVANEINAQKRRVQERSEARTQERRLDGAYSRQLPQTEWITFLFAALLETPHCLPTDRRTIETPFEDDDSGVKGGDSYELKNVVQE